jgi:hypothetical protein
MFFNPTNQQDYCTIIQLKNTQPQSITAYNHNCDDPNIYGYPFCRLLRKF